jgi:glutamine cyclotransferase
MGGEIWANIWLTDFVVRIDPSSGSITGWLDLTGLLTPEEDAAANVLNGIALDANTGRVFVTGKYWPKLFDIQIIPAE